MSTFTALNMNLRNTAITLSFLMEGFNEAHKHTYGAGQTDVACKYGFHQDIHGGHIGIVGDFVHHAWWLQAHLAAREAQDFPGVFEYEVVEGLGAWLFHNPEATFDDFVVHATAEVDKWFREGLGADSGHCGLGCDAGFRTCPDCELNDEQELNAPQPVGAKKESTMKVNDLISALQRIQNQHGDVDILVRGSKPTSFVDAQEVRAVKTPKRRAVYIGKASQTTAQE